MLYVFTWNSDYLIKQEVKAWKNRFISKYWDFNLVHIKNIEITDNNFLTENICSSSFLNEKKLIIIDLDDKWLTKKEEFLIKILNNIAENNIILVNLIDPDKRTKLYKYLKKYSGLKEFNTKNDTEIYDIISNKYWNKISRDWINLIIKYKSWNLTKIISEIEKLLITIEYIKTKQIVKYIIPELEESIFQIIDDILNRKVTNAISKIDIILNDTNIYAFYNNLIANLRTNIYILKLKNLNLSKSEIWNTLNLWNKIFLINKNYKINYDQAKTLYINIIKIDKKLKTWNLNWTNDSDFKFELEKILLN